MKSMKMAAAAAAAAAFAGCTQYIPSVGPSYEEPEVAAESHPLPDAGYPTTNVAADCSYVPAVTNEDPRVEISREAVAHWWEHFNDPVLEELVLGAATNNLSFQIAKKRLEQANYELLGSYAAFLPRFTGGAAWTLERYGANAASGAGEAVGYKTTSVTLDGNWEIDVFGGSRRQTEANIALAQAEGWSVANAWVALTTQIGVQYVNLRTAQERIAVARTNLVLQAETYDILKSRFDSGIGDELAVNQCAYIVEQTRARIPQLIAIEERLKNALAVLAGVVPGALDQMLRPPKERRDWILAPQKVSELPLNMMRARPDVKERERRLAAMTAYVGVAKAQWFPKLYINGTVGFSKRGGVKLFDRESLFSTIGPAVSWPIFQGGAIYANVKAVEAQMDQAALGYALAVEQACADVRDAYSAYTREYHRLQALTAAVKAASDAVAISKDLYQNGLKDFNNVLDAQRSRLQLEEELVESRGEITVNLINLYKALGGGLAAD